MRRLLAGKFTGFLTLNLALAVMLPVALHGTQWASPRQGILLNGEWQFRRDGEPSDQWKSVQVPSSFQTHEGMDFHGVGWYRKSLGPIEIPKGKRVLVHFQAAATEAEVWLDGERLGMHLGGWTPFRFDITELLRKAGAGKSHQLEVKLDEKVGHNTQGFLPIIAPHFGGIWQEVKLLVVPETYCDELQLMAIGDPLREELRLEIPLAGAMTGSITNVGLRYCLRGEAAWKELSPADIRVSSEPLTDERASNDLKTVLHLRAPIAAPRLWSPSEPNLYEIEIALPGEEGDRLRRPAAFRSMEAFGPEFRLNGKAINIRGVLNWGYSPPLNAPNPGEGAWRSELEFARARGFNLMKFCLWIPPPRYLELADEMGMLTWMEYPTWHPTLTGRFLEPLRQEFREFFQYDRNHPSVVLRSLTCETGPSAELGVIKSLYDLAHRMIPGALVEDDSSWIGWNRVHDFYDDHPYGNNHTWVKTLASFEEYILAHGLKPLVLGEAMAADSWLDRTNLLARLGDQRPWWAPGVLDDTGRWMERMGRISGSASGLELLQADSLRYGMLMRKFQAEVFRREIPYGGYVISVIRDFANASMGLIDYLDRPKWTEADWSWQRDTICLLRTSGDRRSFVSGMPIKGEILLSHFGQQPIKDAQLVVTLTPFGRPTETVQRQEEKGIEQNSGTMSRLMELEFTAPMVEKPTHLLLTADLRTSQGEFRNEWPLWVMPELSTNSLKQVKVHSSLASDLAMSLFPGCPAYGAAEKDADAKFVGETIVVASRFDDGLVKFLETGGKVLLLPDGQRNSFPMSAHWFLRGAPYIPDHALGRQIPRDLLIELQHFDLAGDVVPDLAQLDSFDPILMLWDTHDQKTSVRTHGVVFETRAAKGRLLVSTLRLTQTNNAAGPWLLEVLLEHLRAGAPPRNALSEEVWSYLKARMTADQTNLVACTWRFKPDPKNDGLSLGWQSPALGSEADWKDIRIGAWWESQGYPDLDGWAWYRLWVDIPKSWEGRDVFLSFEGVDDLYELYVGGELAGKGGDLATHKDAFNEKKSHNISHFVKPGQKALLAVRVHDWYGSGGIFRPVTLGTLAIDPMLDLLR